MVPSVPAPGRVIEAFSSAARDASATPRSVEQRDGQVLLHEGKDTVVIARPNKEGAPYRPTISADGSRAAWLRRTPDGPEHMEVIHVHTGLLGSLRRLSGSQFIYFSRPVKAVDLDAKGTRLACLSPDRITVYPLQRYGEHRELALPPAAPGALGVHQRPVDLEYLDDGTIAVLTDAGTAYQLGEKGVLARLSLPHPDNHAADALPQAERAPLLDAYGDSLQAVVPGPDPRHCVVQVREGNGFHSLALDRQTGDVREIGRGPAAPPLWSPDGRFVAIAGPKGALVHPVFGQTRPLEVDLAGARWTDDSRGFVTADGKSIPLSKSLTAWEVDLGATPQAGGAVVKESDFVVINGIKVRRRG